MRLLSVGSFLLVLLGLWAAPVQGQNQDVYRFDDTDGDGEQWRILSYKDNLQIDYSDTYDDVVQFHKDRSATFFGNLGVGEHDPSARFAVSVDGSTTRIGNVTVGCCGDDQIPQGDFRGLIAGWDSDYAFFGLRNYGDDSKDVVINNEQGSDDIRFQSAGRDLMLIEGESGNVGIGTTSPEKALHVKDTNSWQPVVVEGESDGTDVAGYAIFPEGRKSNRIEFAGRMDGGFRIWSGAVNKDVLVSDSGGDVGVGTTSPSKKLSVNGKIRAKEVIVTEENWSDYVFEPDYDLPTLAEVSSFIDREGHLPSVPSAESVEKNGLRLGEMDATLLRKVEELTLYAIEQKRRADSLGTVVRDQRRALKKQQEALQQVRERLRALEQAVDNE